MPLNGTGTFAPIEPEFPAIPETTILASEFNTIITDISEALSLSIYRDGQAVVLANIDWGDNKIVNLAPGSNDKDSVNFDQVFHNPTFVGSLADGVILAGTKTTINSTLLEINSDTVEIDSANIGIHASDNLLLDSDAILNLESPSITLDALNDINLLSALTTINSPNIVLTGDTLATLNTNTTAITQPLTDSSTKLATTEYVANRAFSATLPGQAGNAGALLSTDGTTGYWTKTISGITINQVDNLFTLQDDLDITKQAKFECSAISPGTTRIITMPDENVTLGDSPIKLLQIFNLNAGSSIWEILPTIIDNRFDTYEFEFYGLTITNAGTLSMQLKAGGAYLVTNYASGSNFVNASVPIVSSMTSGAPNYAAGRITFYLPWNTSLRKYGHYLTHEANFSNVGIVMKMVNTSLLALEGFKLYPATGTINAGAVGKWYGLK